MSTQIEEQGDGAFGSRERWFLRGMAVGCLIVASLNAVSYFIRSSTWGSLVGTRQSPNESIGFPFKVWEGGNSYGGLFVDYPRMGLNLLVAVLLGGTIGAISAKHASRLNRLLSASSGEAGEQTDQPDGGNPIQFSLFGLMVATTIAAVVSMIASRFAARRETLVAIYLIGPAFLVAIAMLPRMLSWQQRVKIITPLSLSLIGAAIAVGMAIGMPFDQVLMGIFLCWTPQSALAAIALTVWIFFDLSRRHEIKSSE